MADRNYTIIGPDGREMTIVGPDTATPEQLRAASQQAFSGTPASINNISNPRQSEVPTSTTATGSSNALSRITGNVMSHLSSLRDYQINGGAGLIRGAGSIGSTLLMSPKDIGDAISENSQPNLSSIINGEKPISLDDQRQKSMDDALSSLGADTKSLAFGANKLGAEAAGTMGIGGAAAKLMQTMPWLAKYPSFLDAVRTSGISAGSAKGLTAAALRAAGGATTGGLATALVSPEDAGKGAVIGGALASALPPVMQGAMWLGRKGGELFTKAGGTRAAANSIAEKIGADKINDVINRIRSTPIVNAEDIQLSAAGKTLNPDIAQFEQGSRIRTPSKWFDFDQEQGKSVFDNVINATAEADDLGNRFANRAANWAKNWSAAEKNVDPNIWIKRLGELGSDIENKYMKSPASSITDVRRTFEALSNEIERVGDGFSPAHLQTIRAEFNGKHTPGDINAFKAAPRSNAAVKSLIKEMDDILNETTGGKWDAVKSGYREDSAQVHAAKAAGKIRESFIDADTGRIRGTALDQTGDTPSITSTRLGRAMDSARLADKSLALSKPAEQTLAATLQALRQQNIVQGIKRSATAGGGSDTASNFASIGMGAVPGGVTKNSILSAIDAIKKGATSRYDIGMARLLQNPEELAKMLENISNPTNFLSISNTPKLTTSLGFDTPPRSLSINPLGDLTPEWTTSRGFEQKQIGSLSNEGLYRAALDDPPVASRMKGSLQMPVVPGLPGVDDIAISGEKWVDIKTGAAQRLLSKPKTPAANIEIELHLKDAGIDTKNMSFKKMRDILQKQIAEESKNINIQPK